MTQVTVVGGGLAGLVAAITAAEHGATVTLHEGHRSLGGRWRLARPPYLAHEGPHVVYGDGPLWAWLKQRGLQGATCAVPLTALGGFWFRQRGKLRHSPPAGLVRALLAVRRPEVPSAVSFGDWASPIVGWEATRLAAAAAGVAVFHHDPASLSAQFVAERLRRVFTVPPRAKYRRGGWGAMFDGLHAYATALAVKVELGSRVTELGAGPTIVATSLEAARVLLKDDSLQWPSGRTVLLDLGIRQARRDAFVVSDLDSCGWLETFTVPDPTIAPTGESLVQLQMPIAPKETKIDGVARLEALADTALPGWRERVTYRLEAVADARTGAVDHPGSSWRDRPAIDRGDGIYLTGDRVAAPGLLSEVSLTSAIRAANLAVSRRGPSANGRTGPSVIRRRGSS